MGTTGSTTPGLSMSRRRMYPDENTSYIRLGCPKLIRGVMEDWKYYPQCCFPDWTPDEVHWGGLFHGCEHMELCTVHEVVILDDGGSKQYSITHVDGDEKLTAACWNWLQEPQPARARVLFVENMSSQVLQMLGTKYNVDPSFFLSSMNWVLSRCYQEDPKPKENVTVILPFIRTTRNQQPIERASPIDIPSDGQQKIIQDEMPVKMDDAPFTLRNGMTLLQDLLAIHMVRTPTTSTIISYHPRSNLHGTCAKHLQSFLQHSDNSLILSISEDPTAAFILIMKYVLQEWDEAIGILYNCMIELESDAIGNVSVKVLQELHHLQAHVLCYRALLEHFRKSVAFVRELTPNPLTGARPISDRERRFSADLTKSELANLLSNITRLEEQILMFSDQTQRVRLLWRLDPNNKKSDMFKRLPASLRIGNSLVVASIFGFSVLLYHWPTDKHNTVRETLEGHLPLFFSCTRVLHEREGDRPSYNRDPGSVCWDNDRSNSWHWVACRGAQSPQFFPSWETLHHAKAHVANILCIQHNFQDDLDDQVVPPT